MSCADSIGKLLADAHFTSCFTKVLPSALYCGKPIVVTEGTFLRNSRMAEEERGSVVVTVLVVREVMADAESVGLAAEPAVSIDCETEGVTIDGIDARAFSLRTCQRARSLNARSGEDTLEFERREVPAKGDRLLWQDGGVWREHVVVRTDEPLEGMCSVYAESSLCELLDDFIEEQHLVSRTARQALAVVLAPTRWTIASCDVAGTAGCVLYHVNALWALRRVAEVWGGEVEPVITVADGRVASRSISFKEQLGSWRGLRFTYGKNMAGCTRTVLEQDVYTALYGYGAGLPVTDEDGRYTRRPASKPS